MLSYCPAGQQCYNAGTPKEGSPLPRCETLCPAARDSQIRMHARLHHDDVMPPAGYNRLSLYVIPLYILLSC